MEQSRATTAGAAGEIAQLYKYRPHPAERGVALHQEGRFADAESSYRRALDEEPSYAIAQNNLGVALYHRGAADASLAVFPTTGGPARIACERAVAAARIARERVRAANAARRAAGQPPFSCGVGLHLGRVHYGNIGTPERLEFSVIGAAANKAARIEALCKDTGADVVLSGAMAAALDAGCPSLGRFALRGLAEPEEVFALP